MVLRRRRLDAESALHDLQLHGDPGDRHARRLLADHRDRQSRSSNQIFKLDTATGARTTLAALSYPSYSSNRVGSTWLVGETHETGGITDPQIHLYGSNDGGSTWVVLYAFTIPSGNDYEIHVESVYPNGDVAVDVSGHGTVVLRLGSDSGASTPVNTAPPTINGSAQQGSTLTATAGSWSGSPSSFGYQWQRCDTSGSACNDIATATSSAYVLQGADVGATLRVTVTAANAAGSASAESGHTGTVAGTLSAPVNTNLPTIDGTSQEGESLTATQGDWSGSPSSFGYQWRSVTCPATRAAVSVGPRPRATSFRPRTSARRSGSASRRRTPAAATPRRRPQRRSCSLPQAPATAAAARRRRHGGWRRREHGRWRQLGRRRRHRWRDDRDTPNDRGHRSAHCHHLRTDRTDRGRARADEHRRPAHHRGRAAREDPAGPARLVGGIAHLLPLSVAALPRDRRRLLGDPRRHDEVAPPDDARCASHAAGEDRRRGRRTARVVVVAGYGARQALNRSSVFDASRSSA